MKKLIELVEQFLKLIKYYQIGPIEASAINLLYKQIGDNLNLVTEKAKPYGYYQSLKVVCNETQQIWKNLKSAATDLEINHPFLHLIIVQKKLHNGLTYSYIEETENE